MSRTKALRILRESLVDEALATGDTPEQAEAYATEELRPFFTPIIGRRVSNSILRQAVAGC